MTTEQAQHLLETGAPISPSKTDLRYQFVILRNQGLTNEQIADNLLVQLDLVEETELELVDEFLK